LLHLATAAVPRDRLVAPNEALAAFAAILDHTMVEHPVPRAPRTGAPRPAAKADKTAADAAPVTPQQQQAIAHARGHICKVRGCEVCAPLRERRRLKKAQRKADAQAHAHAKGEPCGRSNCPVPICVRDRHADPATPAPAAPRADGPTDDADGSIRRQAERHRVGLPCGSEDCPNQVCVDGFALERTRRHRARRPCRSSDCANPICVAGRSNA
jgi:hypothetical protein